MFVESIFAMAVDCRARLADTSVNYDKLDRLSQRLRHLAEFPQIAFYGRHMADQLYQMSHVLWKLTSALKETIEGLDTFNALQPSPRIPDSLLEEARAWEVSTHTLCAQVQHVCECVGLSSVPILLDNEYAIVISTISHFANTIATLERWAEVDPRLRHYFVPVKSWLSSQAEISVSSDSDSTTIVQSTDAVIDLLLVHIQSMLSAFPEPVEKTDESERDRYIESDYHGVRNLTQLLKLKQTLDCLDSALLQLAIHSRDNIRTHLQRFLPFIELYLQLAQQQLVAHSEWTKALFKLDFVLCSVTQTIAKDGFCRPPEGDGTETVGDTSEASGVGLGSGEGTENVSKEIEEESQVEGLKGDDDEGNDPKDRSDDNDAIEMTEDIGGNLEDVPDDDEQDEKGSDQGRRKVVGR
ncbi:hypothetical protein GGX14DRAFT_205604 [Mycena pura]|uniref:Uncharacterized protein n=1 Tax=Mycena pura TaxID=153505 RepID=A0AAD6Y435_9AGAR|nr:hypothetical protein GGX14DRAFT_205604 [Mycena pura]